MRDSRAQRARVASGAAPRRRWRPARILLVVLAALYVPYLIGGNIILRTQLIQNVINGALVDSTAGIVVSYDRIWTFFPGHVWVQGAVVRGHDYDVEWMVSVDDHVAWIDPFAFLHRTFRVMRARGTGVELRLRMRRDPSALGDETVKMLPPIAGYADPPVHPSVPRPPPIGPDDAMWSVRLDDVEMKDVREIWIESFRWRDAGTTHGGFAFTPGQALFVHGELTVLAGELTRGDATLLEHTHGRARVAILPLDLNTLDAHTFLRRLVVSGYLDTAIRSPSMVPGLAGAGINNITVEARLAVMGRLGLGVLARDTAVRLWITRAAAHAGHFAVTVHGTGRAHVRSGSAPGGGALVGSVDFSTIDVARLGRTGPPLLHAGLRVDFESPTVDLGGPLDPGKVSVDATGRLADAGLVGPWLPAGIVSPAGAATFDAHLHANTADASGAGRIRLDAPALSFRLQDLAVRGHLSSDIILSGIAFPGGPSRLGSAVFHLNGSHLDLHDVSITKRDRAPTEADWWLRLDVPGAVVLPGSAAIHARLTTRFRDADPILMLLDRSLHVPAVMLKPLTRAEFDARATLRSGPGLFALDDFDVDGGTFRIEGWYHRSAGRRSGAFLAEMGGLALGVDVTTDKVRLIVPRPRDWYAGVAVPR